ncbi:MAG: PIN domain-containing protein [Rhodovibrio sp.]|nr:PIN domain-containing protein [Rhodovibrio sp.]
MIAVDTSVWINFLNGTRGPDVQVLKRLLMTERIAVGDLVMTEVLRGLHDERSAQDVRRFLERGVVVSFVGHTNAVEAAALYRRLRRVGVTVRKTVDLWIATWCIASGVPLLHQDRDFSAIARHEPGLIEVPVPGR